MINFSFLTPFACGLIFLLLGAMMYFFPPKKINSFYGYRTQSSMQSQARWDFAQTYSARQMIRLGILLSVISSVGFFVRLDDILSVAIGLSLLAVLIVVLITCTERAIKKRFGTD